MKLAVITLLALLAMQDGGGQARPDPDELAASYTEAFNAKDAARLAALFAEDTVLMPPDTPMIRGRSAVETAYRARFAEFRIGQLHMRRLDVDTHGERATAAGTFRLVPGQSSGMTSMSEADGNSTTGKYIVIYKRVRNQWLIALQIMNYDSPQLR